MGVKGRAKSAMGTLDAWSLKRGTVIWIPDDEDQVWQKAEVVNVVDGAVTVIPSGSQEEVRLKDQDSMYLSNADVWSEAGGLTGVGDLASLMHLHEPEVLETLQLRFDVDQIYTFCGGILIAVNPFKAIKGLYDQKTLTDAIHAEEKGESTPHIFTIACRTLNNLSTLHESQVVLISGESGAGKTETTKHVLKFLSETLGTSSAGGGSPSSSPSQGRTQRPSLPKNVATDKQKASVSTEQKILNSNPLLEAFGNACTVRNNNSSRFGKFIEMRFRQEVGGSVAFVGASIETYLLEKVRVTEVTEKKAKVTPNKSKESPVAPKQERSYHIFYQACAALKKFGGEAFGLPLDCFGDASTFRYLNRSPLLTLPGQDDANDFSETIKAMASLDLDNEEQRSIVAMVAAVLHIGNIEIEGDGESSKIRAGSKHFEMVASLLKIERGVLARALTNRFIKVSQVEQYDKPLKPKEAEDAREALARALYGSLFLHLVSKVNASLQGDSSNASPVYIGVLDIFGFESFEHNSFEQLCINFANERLQKLFNDFVFLQEMKLYQAENVACDRTDFPDNSDIINLVQGKAPRTSILVALDEECRVPGGRDQGFCDKIRKEFGQLNKSSRFEANPRYPSTFTIHHFAGPVTYECSHFLDKNTDEIGDLMMEALASSADTFVSESLLQHLSGQSERSTGKVNKVTVSTYFKSQLESLMSKLSKAQPHFVRCVKPNPESKPNRLNRKTVVEQLRSGGVLEALRVQRSGYPCRVLLESESFPPYEAWRDYLRILVPKEMRAELRSIRNLRERTQKALELLEKTIPLRADPSGGTFAVGKTRVFFKQATFESLHSAWIGRQNEAATFIQRTCRTSKIHQVLKQIRRNMVLIQANYRGHRLRKALWDAATPEQRATNALFRRYRTTEEEAKAQQLLKAVREKEQVRIEAEQEERRRIKAEEEKKQREEEERRAAEERKRREEEERRAEELRKKAEEERRRVEEERKRAEEQRQKLLHAEQQVHGLTLDVRKLQGDIESARHETQMAKVEHQQQMTLAITQEKALLARIAELEKENERLRAEITEYLDKLANVQEERDRELAAVVAAQEQVQTEAASQVEALRTTLEEKHANQLHALKDREAVLQDRFNEQANLLREHQLKQAQRHADELERISSEQSQRQKKFDDEIFEAQQRASDSAADRQMMEQQVLSLRRENERIVSIMTTQAEELKRMFTSEISLMQSRQLEQERSLQEEVELVTKQRDEQLASFNAQLESQKQVMLSSCQQEVDFVKKQSEQREKSLMQMLERAREGESEQKKSLEVQLDLQQRQAAEIKRVLEAKNSHLEEAGKRAQELYEQHVEQLSRQLQEKTESFQTQLAEAEERAALHLAEVNGEFRTLEARMKLEREQQQEMLQALQSAAPECRKLQELLQESQKEAGELKRQLIDARARLSAKVEEEKLRKQFEADIGASKPPVATQARRRSSLRIDALPRKMAPPAWAAATGARKLKRTQTVDPLQLSSLLAGAPEEMVVSPTKIRSNANHNPPARDFEHELLRPSQTADGEECLGPVCPWQEVTIDSAITALCMSSYPLQTSVVMLAVGGQKGNVFVYDVPGSYGASEDEGPPSEKLQFKAHSKAITYMSFGSRRDELITTSTDFRVRIWGLLKDGSLLYEVEEASLVPCAIPTREPEGGLLIASEGKRQIAPLLKLNIGDECVQKVRLDRPVRCLALDATGTRLVAGSSHGQVLCFDVACEKLQLRSKLKATHSGISCITIALTGDGTPPLVVLNASDSSVCVLQANADLTNLTVIRRFHNPHKLLPLRSCYVPFAGDAGFIVSGAEEADLNVFDMENFGRGKLKGHKVPIVDVDVSEDLTLMASGDVRGTVILWRRTPG